jgi:hypothetical protein
VFRAGVALLVAAVTAGCDGGTSKAAAPKVERWQAEPQPSPWHRSDGVPPPPPMFFSLLIVDQDAGGALPEGGRAGGLLVAAGTDAAGRFRESNLRLVATDSRWWDPTDALQLPDGSWLVLESKWAPGAGEARGAIFRLPKLGAEPELWWTDVRSRQPVAFVRDDQGTLFVSDRDADPDGVRSAEPNRQRTGCVFGIEVGADGRPSRTEVVAAGPQFCTPGALLALGPLLYLMDADANPRGLRAADGRLSTPGVLFDLVRTQGAERLSRRRADVLVESTITTSPVGLILRPAFDVPAPPDEWTGLGADDPLPAWLPEIFLVDANFVQQGDAQGDGALFWVRLGSGEPGRAHGLSAKLEMRVDPNRLPRHTLVDPAYGCALPMGSIVIADANADPKQLGADGTGKGVYGTGHGALFETSADAPDSLRLLIASDLFVTPVAVRAFETP